MKKRWISLLLVFTMVAAMVPQVAIEARAVQSGTCGDNLTWVLDDAGTLTISGTGAMYDYLWNGNKSIPWKDNRSAIETLIITDGVTSIGAEAFSYCENLKTVEIADTVSSIGEFSFGRCTSLSSIAIPRNVVFLDLDIFLYCSSLANITVSGQNTSYASIDGVVFSKDMTELLIYPNGRDGAYAIPSGINKVSSHAFRACKGLTAITFPDSVTEIGEYAFDECYNLSDIRLPSNLVTIGTEAFSGCVSLSEEGIPTSVTYIGDNAFSDCDFGREVTITEKVTYIGYAAFSGCNLEEIHVADNNPFYSAINGVLFSKDLSTIHTYPSAKKDIMYAVPQNVSIISKQAFNSVHALTAISFPLNTVSIENGAFFYVPNLTDIYYAGTEAQWNLVDIGAWNESLTNATIHFELDYRSVWIEQHIAYFNSEQYERDILPGYTLYLDFVLDDALSDWSVKGYNILDAVNEFAALDVELDGVDMYELLLAQLLYNDHSRNQIQELYNGNVHAIVSETIKTLIDKLEPKSAAQVKCNELFEKLKKYDFDSDLFQNTYSELMDELADQITPRKAAEALEKFGFVAGLGIDAISQAGSTVNEIVEYIVYGQAYLNTSDDFRTVLLLLCYQFPTVDPAPILERFGGNVFDDLGNLWNYSEFEVALQNFFVEMETYRLDAATAIANKAKTAITDGTQSFVNDSVREIAKECGDTILSYIPVLRWLPVVRDGLAAGQLLIDIFTNVDNRAYSVDMLKRLYIMAYVMDTTVDFIGANMTRDDFATVTRFDKSVSLYKAILSIAADYGAKYEEELLKAENGKAEIFRSQKKVSWYSSALSMMAVQKLMLEDIHCHSLWLLYDHHTQEITYDSTKLQIFVVACPVDVTVYDNADKWIASLRNDGLNICAGYEKYFFICELDNDTGDYMKVAIVPNDYEVVLDGVGTGSMNVYIANYTEGNIEEAIGFYDIPVTEDTTGYFVANEERTELENLVVDETVYVGDDTDPGVNPFTDVPEGSFYYEPVHWALENNITTGATETTFNPTGDCLRAQVVTFLWRAAGEPKPTSTHNPFVDVKPSDFCYDAVLWAVENGITNGADATHFNPMGVCNRAQVVTFLYRTFHSPAVENGNNPFTDVPTGTWYTDPILWAVENGITNGLSATQFGPNTNCNRAQIVTFLYRAYN